MEHLNESLKEAVCIEEEVFFGPIADKERKIRENFENVFINENKTIESHLAGENDISKNDSLYKSFSVDESKYDSFDDSLNEDEKRPQEAKHITVRKSFDKLKTKTHAFYDSLEDVCSLVSNIDKCSISCEVENSSNFNNKPNVIEDSLKNPPVAVANKSSGVNEQVHFDDDSLAILELENTFDDSLEEINDVCVLENIEIEEIDDIENMTTENQNVSIKVEQNPVSFPRNLFDTSVQIVYEKKWACDIADQEESSDDKNMYDSISNSDLKDILKDSLEESEKCTANLKFLKPVLGTTDVNVKKSGGMFTSQNALDASVQIVYEDFQNTCLTGSTSEKTNSECNEFSKDSLENCKNVDEQTNIKTFNEDDFHSSNVIAVLSNENITSKEFSKNLFTDAADNVNKLCSSSNANQSCEIMKDISVITEPVREIPVSAITDASDSVLHSNSNVDQNCKIMKDISVITEPAIDNALCSDTNANQNYKILKDTSAITEHVIPVSAITTASDNVLCSDSDANQNYKIMKDTSVITEPVIPVSTTDNFSRKEAFSVDSCHLKFLNDDLNIDADLKFQLHLEVTVGDKKCQIASQEIKVFPSTDGHSKECESKSLTHIPSEDYFSQRDVLDNSNSKLDSNTEACNAVGENFMCNEAKPKLINTSNVTRRTKSSRSHSVIQSEEKFNFPENLSNISLLEALDLHDISASFLNESVIQSNDSLMPLNLCCKEQNIYTPILRDESKENVPQPLLTRKKGFCTSSRKVSPNKVCVNKTPKHFQKSPSLKDSSKKTGTKIPVRKIENFAIPTVTPSKPGKQIPTVKSAERVIKCQQSPHSASKKTPVTTPNKTPHFCKVRNTIFSKVPLITPSKKFMNVPSPVAQYIRNIHGSGKPHHFEPVLRDCMNQPLESPYHSHHIPKSGTLKSTKKKA